MPLGDYTKDKVREIAFNLGFKVAQKPDSQEICSLLYTNTKNYIIDLQYDLSLEIDNI